MAARTPKKYLDQMDDGRDASCKDEGPDDGRQAFNELAAEVERKADRVLETLELGLKHAAAVLRLPGKYRRRLRTSNMVERLIEEVRRREKVTRISPNDDSTWGLIGAFLAERHEEWSTRPKHLKMDLYYEADARESEVSHVRPMATD